MVPKPGCRQFVLSCECVSIWHKEPMLDVKNLGVSRWWIRWELFTLGKVDFFNRDNLRKLKGKRNLEAARMHTALFRKGDAKKEKVYALNTGNSNDMGLLWLWGKQLQLGATWSIRDWDFLFPPEEWLQGNISLLGLQITTDHKRNRRAIANSNSWNSYY